MITSENTVVFQVVLEATDGFFQHTSGTSVCNQDDSSSQRMEDFFYEVMTCIIFEDVAWFDKWIYHVGRKGYKMGPYQL